MGRDSTTRDLGEIITMKFVEFKKLGGVDKLEFMKMIPGVTADIRKEFHPGRTFLQPFPTTSYYCTFVFEGRLVQCWSYDNETEWGCKY